MRRHFVLAVFLLLFLPTVCARLEVVVISPDNGEQLWGTFPIKWAGACDPPDNVTYTIEISTNRGTTWQTVGVKEFYEIEMLTPHEISFNSVGIEKSTTCLVRVSARNSRGEENMDTSDDIFTIQNILPPPTLISPADGSSIASRMPVLVWMDEESPWGIENHWVEVSKDPYFTPRYILWASATGPETSVTVGSALPEGKYYWRVKAVDNRGVESEFSQPFSFEVFTYAPVITAINPSKRYVNARRAELIVGYQNIYLISYSLDLVNWSNWEILSTNPQGQPALVVTFSENERDGEKTIYVRGQSQGGKVSDIKSVKVCLDTQPPVVTPQYSGVLGERGYKGSVTINLVAFDITSGVETIMYKVDDGPWENGSTFTIATDGEHTVEYVVSDRAGNVRRETLYVSVYTPLSPVPYMAFFTGTIGVAVFWVYMWKRGIPAIAAWRKQRQLRSRWFQELVGWTEEVPEVKVPAGAGKAALKEAREAPETVSKPPRTSSIVQSYKELLMPAAERLAEKKAARDISDLISQLEQVSKKK
ncbi:MAG: hypothetical protein QXG14_04560 [Candidatus Hadarchaeales archaeon]